MHTGEWCSLGLSVLCSVGTSSAQESNLDIRSRLVFTWVVLFPKAGKWIPFFSNSFCSPNVLARTAHGVRSEGVGADSQQHLGCPAGSGGSRHRGLPRRPRLGEAGWENPGGSSQPRLWDVLKMRPNFFCPPFSGVRDFLKHALVNIGCFPCEQMCRCLPSSGTRGTPMQLSI